jgi:hypothetical protein
MRRSANVATPPTARTVVVPLKDPPDELAPSLTVTSCVVPGTGVPSGRRTSTLGAGLIGTEPSAGPGCTTNSSTSGAGVGAAGPSPQARITAAPASAPVFSRAAVGRARARREPSPGAHPAKS